MRKSAQPVTKQDFRVFRKDMHSEWSGFQSMMQESMLELRNDFLTELRDFRVEVNSKFHGVDEEFRIVHEEFQVVHREIGDLQEDMSKVKLAVIDLTGTDRTVRHLVRELKGQGIKPDESRIF